MFCGRFEKSIQSAIFICCILLLNSQIVFAALEAVLAQVNSTENLIVKYYQVKGLSGKELRQELDKLGPVDKAGRRGDAYTAWKISWDWPINNKQPDFSKVSVRHSIVMTLPDWVDKDKASIELQETWNKFIEALMRHELNHVSHVINYKNDIATKIKDAAIKNNKLTVKAANEIARSVLSKIRHLDHSYDVKTIHGKSEGVRFP